MWTPLGNETMKVATWRPEPNGRGTWSILSGCIITLTLCIWTALHLSIPEHGKVGKQLWRKTKWLMVGLLAPEMIVFVAFVQGLSQKKLGKGMRQALGGAHSTEKKKPRMWGDLGVLLRLRPPPVVDDCIALEEATPQKRHVWTATHSFFALMGGFAFDVSPRPELTPLPQGRTRLVLTVKGLKWIARNRPDLFPNISAEQIQDKSKANQLAKALVCIQATYFGFNFITRLCLGFAVTLLEINTFAHAACALLVYLIWWDKPLDIEVPVLIPMEDDGAASICAAMYLGSNIGQIQPARDFVDQGMSSNESSNESQPPTHRPLPSSSLFERIYAHVSAKPIVYVEFNTKPHEDTSRDELVTRCRFTTIAAWTQLEVLRQLPRVIPHDLLVLRRSAVSTEHGKDILAGSSSAGYQTKKSGWVGYRASNWPEAKSTAIALLFIAASTMYGSWHLIAWNGSFHGHISEIIWRLSGLGVAVPGLLILIVSCVSLMLVILSKEMLFGLIVFTIPLGVCLGGGLALLLVFSRFYLIVGAIIGLPYASDSAFMTPEWSQYFPHIG